jgi:hypothetical protein
MYAFVVMIVLNGTPHSFIMERGLTAAECRAVAARPDSGIRIDGQPVASEGRCILEADLAKGELPS